MLFSVRNSIWIVYVLLALLTLFVWTEKKQFSVTGDEPHYLVMADGIVNDGSFEQTSAYAREFNGRKLFPAGLASKEAKPEPNNTHSVLGPNGLYNIHNIGLPLVISVPYAIAGTIGVKVFMVLLSSLLVPLVWSTAGLFTSSETHRALATSALVFAAPIIPASNQIYPDLLAGMIALTACYWLLKRQLNPTDNIKKDIAIALLVSLLPWLQIKFVAAALILAVALTLQSYIQYRSLKKVSFICCRIGLFLFVVVMSISLLSAYNNYAFGKFSGPYQDGALQFSLHAIMVFFGLHLDRFQGIFIQNPVYFFGLIMLFPFLKRHWFPVLTILLVYASFLVPNALHPNWYGGASFAGRFAWSGALVILPIVVFSLIRIMSDTKKGFFVVIVLIAVNLLTYATYTFKMFDLYNISANAEYAKGIWLDSYGSFHPLIKNYLPAFYDSSRAFEYGPNASFLVLFVGLIVLGGFYNQNMYRDYYRNIQRFILVSFVFIVISGLTSSSDDRSKFWAGSDLPSNVGVVIGNARMTNFDISSAGFLTFGPYIKLNEGKYQFELNVDAFYEEEGAVGWIDVFVPSENITLFKVEVFPSLNPQLIKKVFEIPPSLSPSTIEIRTFFLGKGELNVHSLTLDKIPGHLLGFNFDKDKL